MADLATVRRFCRTGRRGTAHLPRMALPDGTEVMLDELCDEAGVPRYPLLEDMPPEIGLETEAG